MRLLKLLLFCFLLNFSVQAKDYKLLSPDKKNELTISINNIVEIKITNNSAVILERTPLNFIVDQKELFTNSRVSGTKYTTANKTVIPVVKIKSEKIAEQYNELTISFKEGYAIIFRAYNEGIAYRFKTGFKKDIIVTNETLRLNLPKSCFGYLMKEAGFSSMSESPYIPSLVEDYADGSLFSLPCLFKIPNGNFLMVTESDVDDYPALWMKKENGLLTATLPQKVTKTKEGNCLGNTNVVERAPYLAETKGNRHFPWRAFIIGNTEKDLVTNQLVYLLAKPENGDYSWVQPGLTTLDWWGRRNIFGTDFKGGVNTATQNYFIDFNNKYGVKYFVLDEGWSTRCDLKNTNKDINLDSLKLYAASKNVGLIYWVYAFGLAQDVGGYMDFLKSKGAAGLKVDFFMRDDQEAINLLHTIAKEAAKRKLMLDFHGLGKPFGLNRTYPNLLTSEGLIEFEMNGVTDWANPVHHTILPFVRMVTGPMDYLPGTLNNAQKDEFYKYGNRPVGLGSRAHSMALAVLFESPMTMWPDSPSDYLREDDCTQFLAKIPVVWDETKVIDAKIGEYVIMARRNGNNWYIGAITNWSARNLEVPLNFLPAGNYALEAIADGPNTNSRAIDYKKEKLTVNNQATLNLSLANGGGWVGILSK